MRGAWCVVRGAWCVVRGAWCVVRGVWCVVRGAWCVVRGAWCVLARHKRGTRTAHAARTRLCSTMWSRLKPRAACAARGARLDASCSPSCNGCSALLAPRRGGFSRTGACGTAAGSAASSGAGSTRARIVSGDCPDAPDTISKGRPLGVTLSASSRSSHSPLTRAVKSRPV